MGKRVLFLLVLGVFGIVATFVFLSRPPDPLDEAHEIFLASGFTGGLVVHLDCGDGLLTTALRLNENVTVHGLARREEDLMEARKTVLASGLYGPVSIDLLSGDQLPYVDSLVNLLVSKNLGSVPISEVERILCPGGIAYIQKDGIGANAQKFVPLNWTSGRTTFMGRVETPFRVT